MPVYRQKMVDLPEKARILAIDCGGVLSAKTDDVKYDDDKIYKAAMEGAYCLVQMYKFKSGRWPHVVSRVNFPSNKHWVLRFCKHTFGIPDECIHLVREKAEKGPVCAQLGATAVVDDSYDALYAMGTGAWETLASAVLFQEQGKPLSKQGLWDSWLLENKLEFAGNMLELMVALGIARTMTQAEEYQSLFRWGPPTHPHSEERLETALAVIRGIPQAVQAREAEVASAADADAHGVDYSADDQAPGASVAKAAAAAPPPKHALHHLRSMRLLRPTLLRQLLRPLLKLLHLQSMRLLRPTLLRQWLLRPILLHLRSMRLLRRPTLLRQWLLRPLLLRLLLPLLHTWLLRPLEL